MRIKYLFNFLFFFISLQTNGQVRLPRLIRDSMILQRETALNIWGWSSPGEKISIQFNGKKYSVTADGKGKWSRTIPAQKAGGPHTMKITGKNSIVLKNILIGDVWFCSGQSNMVHQMRLHSERYAKEIAEANNPQIRHFFIPTMTDLTGPRTDFPTGFWKSANPNDVLEFSAVAYFFANNIYEKYKIPIGLINASVGGTPIEAWISESGFRSFPNELATIEKLKDTAYVNSTNRAAFVAANTKIVDKGLTSPVKWYETSYMPKGWHSINIPGYWEDQGVRDLNGVVWYRKEIEVPLAMAGKPGKIQMGRIVDADIVYLNGQQVGTTSYQYPQRRYAIPPGLLKAGKNLMVIRVTNQQNKGGFVPDKPYTIIVGSDTIDLKGEWQFKVGEVYQPLNINTAGRPRAIAAQNSPAALYNAMVAPAVPFKVKGFLWYQGEANTGRAREYAQLLPALVNNWRSLWDEKNAPFIWAQLPGFMDRTYLPSESQWAALREAQLQSLQVPNTAMAITIDLGEWNDIHPDNKKDVGVRMALAAKRIAYGDTAVVYSGPIFQSWLIEGNRIVLDFKHTGSGLIANDDEDLRQFAIAGADGKFVWANAIIDGNKVIVWSEEIKDPKFVRYAWADNPEGANLYNKEGLPASPFRTD
ncbi:sialate O-acetylesterase [Pollutibacter soli]|uniref:sialate O-acetylesterase n=1 Tax=Pollutibacter soli TaxID=3034157 RepID=UPI003013EC0D